MGSFCFLLMFSFVTTFVKPNFFSAIARLRFKFTDHKHFYNIEHQNILFLAFDSPDRGLNVMATSNSITLI